MVSSAQWCTGPSVSFVMLSQLSNGGSKLTDTECGKQCYHVKASQFTRKALSCLYVGLVMVRINIKI